MEPSKSTFLVTGAGAGVGFASRSTLYSVTKGALHSFTRSLRRPPVGG